MYNFKYLLIFSGFLAVAGCLPHNKSQVVTPPALSVRQRLFQYFESGGFLPELDTMDACPSCQYLITWALVKSGHIFSETEKHGIIYYLHEQRASMYVFKFQQKHWTQIYQDTTMPYNEMPQFTDWNGDGIKDIVVPVSTDDRNKKYWLWLMGTNGQSMHKVSGFEGLLNPHPAAAPDHVYTYAYYRGPRTELYHFEGHGIKLVRGLEVEWLRETTHPDSACLIYYWDSDDAKAQTLFSGVQNIESTIPPAYRQLRIVQNAFSEHGGWPDTLTQ